MNKIVSNNQRGFSLLETFVALAILSLSLGTIYQSQVNSVRSVSYSAALNRLILYSQSLIAEHSGPYSNNQMSNGSFEGSTSEGMRWRIDKHMLELPALIPGGEPILVNNIDLSFFVINGLRVKEYRFTTLDSL